jgi:hypothetical protein
VQVFRSRQPHWNLNVNASQEAPVFPFGLPIFTPTSLLVFDCRDATNPVPLTLDWEGDCDSDGGRMGSEGSGGFVFGNVREWGSPAARLVGNVGGGLIGSDG